MPHVTRQNREQGVNRRLVGLRVRPASLFGLSVTEPVSEQDSYGVVRIRSQRSQRFALPPSATAVRFLPGGPERL